MPRRPHRRETTAGTQATNAEKAGRLAGERRYSLDKKALARLHRNSRIDTTLYLVGVGVNRIGTDQTLPQHPEEGYKMDANAVESVVPNSAAKAPEPRQRYVYIAAIFAAIGGLLFGYDTGVISGALIFIKRSFGLSIFQQELAVSSVLVGAAVLAITGGSLSDRFGRRKMLRITSVVSIAGALVYAAAGSIQILILGRVIVGMGIGLASSVVPLYISEISPANARGWQVSLFQLAITVEILAAYLADYAFTPSAA